MAEYSLRDDISEVKRQNNEAKLMMYKDIIWLYIKCLVYCPKEVEVRKKMLRMMKGFFKHLSNEAEILDVLGSAYISQKEFDDILIQLDDEFDKAFTYYDGVLADVEESLELRDFRIFLHRNEDTPGIDQDKKEKIGEMILRLEEANRKRSPEEIHN